MDDSAFDFATAPAQHESGEASCSRVGADIDAELSSFCSQHGWDDTDSLYSLRYVQLHTIRGLFRCVKSWKKLERSLHVLICETVERSSEALSVSTWPSPVRSSQGVLRLGNASNTCLRHE